MKAVVVGSANSIPEKILIAEARSSDLLVAADSGAEHCLRLGLLPQRIVGDLDSISKKTLEALQAQSQIYRFPTDKDFTDLELSIFEAERSGCTHLQVFGWADERIDYSIHSLLQFQNAKMRIEWFARSYRLVLLNSYSPEYKFERRDHLTGRLSFFSFSHELALHTEGLRWAVSGSRQGPWISQSNEVKDATAVIHLKAGSLFVLEEFSSQNLD